MMDSRNGRIGLVIGKFCPPHRGHEHLIRSAQAQVDHLIVLVFTKSHEPVPGDLRWQWMQQMFPDIDLRRITDEHPTDFQSAAIWDLWMKSIHRNERD